MSSALRARRIPLGILLVSLVVHADDLTAPSLPVASFRLANGLEVVLAPDPGVSSVVVDVRYHTGSRDDPPGRAGLAHLVERLMFRGSRHVRDGAFERLLDDAGGWSDAATTIGATSFVDQVPQASLELALYLEADRMAGLAFTPDALATTRDAIAAERREQNVTRAAITGALWPDRASVIGSDELEAISSGEVATWWAAHYRPSNATLVIAGRFDAHELRAQVQRYFGWMPAQPHPAASSIPAPTPLAAPVSLAIMGDLDTPRVLVAFRTDVAGSAVADDLAIAARILASGKRSRLYVRLVTTAQVASEVRVELVPGPHGGELVIEVAVREGVQPGAIRAAISDELARLGTAPVSRDELERARAMAERELLVGLEGLAFRTSTFATWAEQAGTPDELDHALARLAAVSITSVRATARLWLDPRAAVTMTVSPR